MYSTSQLAQTTLRSVLGQVELDELLSQREKLNLQLQSILDEDTEPWGVKVAKVEVKQVDLPEQMIFDPFLTVVAQPAYEMGQQATQLLLNRLSGIDTDQPHEIILPTQLIVRVSSGPISGNVP